MNLHCEASPGPFTAAQGAELDNLTTDLARVFPAEGCAGNRGSLRERPNFKSGGRHRLQNGNGRCNQMQTVQHGNDSQDVGDWKSLAHCQTTRFVGPISRLNRDSLQGRNGNPRRACRQTRLNNTTEATWSLGNTAPTSSCIGADGKRLSRSVHPHEPRDPPTVIIRQRVSTVAPK